VAAEFAITVTSANGVTEVRLEGDLDIVAAPELRRALNDVHGPVLFDFAEVPFMDARGLGVLMETERKNGGVVIRNASPLARRIFDIFGLNQWLDPDGVLSGSGPDGSGPDRSGPEKRASDFGLAVGNRGLVDAESA